MEINVFKDALSVLFVACKRSGNSQTAISSPPQFLWQPFRGYACL